MYNVIVTVTNLCSFAGFNCRNWIMTHGMETVNKCVTYGKGFIKAAVSHNKPRGCVEPFVCCMLLTLRVQWILGTGFPDALHSRVIDPPFRAFS